MDICVLSCRARIKEKLKIILYIYIYLLFFIPEPVIDSDLTFKRAYNIIPPKLGTITM